MQTKTKFKKFHTTILRLSEEGREPHQEEVVAENKKVFVHQQAPAERNHTDFRDNRPKSPHEPPKKDFHYQRRL